ncbi:MAG: MFS transporter [Elusimicrobia bacterium GWA2_69_24]|nr:MAG: MFS transporter [Elusimicrobia bacterium GWA2_69_24]HBL15210.1 MFS transporter [Elusimicrobiota bacterium]
MRLGERLDTLPLSRFHWSIVAVSGMGWMFDAMDSGLVSFVLPVLAKEWGLTPMQVGRIGSMGLVGMFAGAILVGMVADRFGRKLLFQTTLAVFSVATGLCGLTWNYGSILVMRFFVGFGLGGELPVASTLVSEFSPKAHRGKLVVILESFWAFGWALAAIVAYLLIPRFGWRIAFLLGSLPVLYVLYLRRAVPESPRFLESQGRWEEAVAVVRSVETACGQSPEPLEPGTAPRAQSQGFRALWSGTMLRRTVMLWILWFAMVYSYYGIFTWLPSLLVASGHSLVKSFSYVLVITAAQIPGYFSAAWLVDRWGRKSTLVAYLVGCAVSALVFGRVATPSSIMLWGSLISFFNLGAWGVVYTYTPESYPTALRGTGSGWAAGVGRIGGIIAPLVVGFIMERWQGRQDIVFAQFAAVVVVGLLAVVALGEETQGRSLEQIAA